MLLDVLGNQNETFIAQIPLYMVYHTFLDNLGLYDIHASHMWHLNCVHFCHIESDITLCYCFTCIVLDCCELLILFIDNISAITVTVITPIVRSVQFMILFLPIIWFSERVVFQLCW